MKTKELQDKLVANMTAWQEVESDSIEMTARVSKKTDNPIVRQVMAIIMQDSSTHHRVQQFIIDSLTKETVSLQPEELADVWGLVEKHIALERKTIEYAKEALATLKGTRMMVQQYLLEYMLIDEEKHNKILDNLEGIKKGMYPYA
jgi:bacterioferritin (cytochrome b1)